MQHIAARFARGRPIDPGSNSGDKMKLAAFGSVAEGPIDLGSDSGNETKISRDNVPREKRTLTAAEFQ